MAIEQIGPVQFDAVRDADVTDGPPGLVSAVPSFFLYYPSRRQQPAAMTALIESLRMERIA